MWILSTRKSMPKNCCIDSVQLVEQRDSVVRVTVGFNLHMFIGNVTVVCLGAYVHEIPKLSRRTVRGTVGLIVRLLGAGVEKRGRKAAPYPAPGGDVS